MKPRPSLPMQLGAACRGAGQRGVSLLFALIALVALSLASIALIRSTETGTVVMGNLGFKQEATAVADLAAKQAIDWMKTNTANLNNSALKGVGYYAANVAGLDPTGHGSDAESRALVDWESDGCKYASKGQCTVFPNVIKAEDAAGLKGLKDKDASYVIFRLCSQEGEPTAAGNTCMSASTVKAIAADDDTPKKGEIKGGEEDRLSSSGSTGSSSTSASKSAYYRIIVRVIGARGAASFTETIIHF